MKKEKTVKKKNQPTVEGIILQVLQVVCSEQTRGGLFQDDQSRGAELWSACSSAICIWWEPSNNWEHSSWIVHHYKWVNIGWFGTPTLRNTHISVCGERYSAFSTWPTTSYGEGEGNRGVAIGQILGELPSSETGSSMEKIWLPTCNGYPRLVFMFCCFLSGFRSYLEWPVLILGLLGI